MMDGSGLDLVTALNTSRGYNDGYDGDGMFGGGGLWILIILFFIMGAGNGFGGFGGGNAAVNTLTNEFLYTNLNNTLDRGFNQLANQNFGIQKDLCQGFGQTQLEIMNSRFAAQECCCETNRNIDSVRYENAKNTCDIITAGNANTQRIIDMFTADKIDTLNRDLQAAQLTLQNQAQTASLLSALRPTPIPAYPSCSPYTSYNWGNMGCGGCNTCGC